MKKKIHITREKLIYLHNEKFFNQSQIAKLYNCSNSTIQSLFSKYNIKVLKSRDIVLIRGVKECYECKEIKQLECFYKSEERSDGFDRRCKDCSSVRSRLIKEKNKKNNANGISLNKKKKCPRCNEYKWLYEFNNARAKSLGVCVYCRVCDKIIRDENKEKRAIIHRQWRKNNPEKSRACSRRRRDRKRKLDCEYSEVCETITMNVFNNRCFNCGNTDKLCIDHHYPLSKGFGLSIQNAVVLCNMCNISKGDKLPEEFYSPDKIKTLCELICKAQVRYMKTIKDNNNE